MMKLTSTEAGGDLRLPYPLEKFVFGQKSALNGQRLVLLWIFFNEHPHCSSDLRQQVKETSFALPKNVRGLLSEKL